MAQRPARASRLRRPACRSSGTPIHLASVSHRGSDAVRVGRVGAAVGDDRPAIVQASLDDVDLVAALRAVIGLPQLAGFWMNGQPQGVPNAQSVNLRLVPGPADEWIVFGRAPIFIQTENLAGVLGRVLRPGRMADKRCAFSAGGKRRPDGHVDLAIATEHDARGARSICPRAGCENLVYL